MKRTPSSARRIARSVLSAVEPTYSPTSPARSTSTRWPFSSSPIDRYICASSRAIVVLPVPGLPRKTRCCEVATSGRPCSRRRPCTWRKASSARTCSLTVSRPTRASSSAWSSSSDRGGSGRASCSLTQSRGSAPAASASRSRMTRNPRPRSSSGAGLIGLGSPAGRRRPPPRRAGSPERPAHHEPRGGEGEEPAELRTVRDQPGGEDDEQDEREGEPDNRLDRGHGEAVRRGAGRLERLTHDQRRRPRGRQPPARGPEVGMVARVERDPEPLLELVGGQPPLEVVPAQERRGSFPLTIADQRHRDDGSHETASQRVFFFTSLRALPTVCCVLPFAACAAPFASVLPLRVW